MMAMHSVAVKFKYGSADKEPLYELEEKMQEAVDEAGAGDYDGHEMSIDDSEGYFYLVGPDARTLWEAIEPVVSKSKLMRGAEVELRMGDVDDEDTEIETFRVGR
jgi:hypothetical protein